MVKKYAPFLLILSLLGLLISYNGYNKSQSNDIKYNLHNYLNNNTYDYVYGTKTTKSNGKRLHIQRDTTNKDVINNILQYFDSFEYIKPQNKEPDSSSIEYEFTFENNDNYTSISIHVLNNKELDIVLREKAIGKDNTIFFLETINKEFEMNYLELLYNSLSNKL